MRRGQEQLIGNIILRILKSAGVPNVLEPAGLSRSDGKRPDGLTMVPWARGKYLLWDATCCHRLAPSYSTIVCDPDANVTARAEEMKTVKHAELTGDYTFLPAAFESLGGYGPETFQFTHSIGKHLSQHTFDIRQLTC